MNQEHNDQHGGAPPGHHPGYKDWHGTPPAPPNPWDLERRVSLLEQSTKTIKDELSKINSNLSKLVWIVITAVLLGGMNVLLSGGVGA